jgi:hypothetical protein
MSYLSGIGRWRLPTDLFPSAQPPQLRRPPWVIVVYRCLCFGPYSCAF